MAYVPGCRHDLFISYAVQNNRERWVERFVDALGQELAELLGRQFVPKDSIFFDVRELEVAQSFSQRLVDAARDSAILLPLLSPGYLDSPWCDQERTDFFSKLPYGATEADCLAPVLVRPIEEAGLEKRFRDAQRLSFLPDGGHVPFSVGSLEWDAQLRKLAGQLKKALQSLRRKCRPVFLGRIVDPERFRRLRPWCGAELERRYFRTVPESLQALHDEEAVRSALQHAGLAVHFLDQADLSVLNAIETSVEACIGPTILYQSFGGRLSPETELWLGEFERTLTLPPGRYQRIAGKNDQELLSLIDEVVSGTREEPIPIPAKFNLALVCDEVDLLSARRLESDILRRNGPPLAFPDFLGSPMKAMERLRRWNDYLNRGQAYLFYRGAGERQRLEPIWRMAESSRRAWFLADPAGPPDNEPDALWTVDQVLQFASHERSAHA
jgi:hypothetical protein